MDFNLPEELQMLKDTLRKFVDNELIPIEMQSIENMELKPDIRERLEKKTKEMGLWMFDVPEEYGGGGLGSLAQVLVWEELARTAALPSRGQGISGRRFGRFFARSTRSRRSASWIRSCAARKSFASCRPSRMPDPIPLR